MNVSKMMKNAKLSAGVLRVIAINAYQRDKLERPCCNYNGGALSPFKTPGVSMVCIPFAHGMLCITFKWNLYDLRVWSTLSEKKILTKILLTLKSCNFMLYKKDAQNLRQSQRGQGKDKSPW